MNKVVIMGRLTRDPEIRESNEYITARYTLAVDRRVSKGQEKQADFINCVAFSKSTDKGGGAIFVKNYCHKGTKLVVSGRIQTGSYQKQDGTKVYTTDVVAEEQEFAESKNSAPEAASNGTAMGTNDFMQIPDGIDEELPFN